MTSWKKERKYHLVRISYSDGKVNNRVFLEKTTALLWLRKRRATPLGDEKVTYAGTYRAHIARRSIMKSERLARMSAK